MITSKGFLIVRDIYSSDYNFEKDGQKIQGTSLKLRAVDEDSDVNPQYKIDPDFYKKAQLDTTEVKSQFIKKKVEVVFLHKPRISQGGIISTDLIIIDIQLSK